MAKEHLIKARELIEAGWVQTDMHRMVNGKDCYCLDGAIAKAHGLDDMYNNSPYRFLENDPGARADVAVVFDVIPVEHTQEIRDVIEEPGFNPLTLRMEGLYRFNDSVAHSKEDVLAVLDKAIENYPDEIGI